MGVFGAVFHHQPHLGARPARPLELAGLERAAQAQGLGRRLREVHVQAVHLLDQRHLGRLALPDQRAFGDERAADAAGDRRAHGGVIDVELRGLHGGLGGGDIGLRLLHCRLCGDPFGLADGLGGDQRLVARQRGLGLREVGFGLGLGGGGAVERGAVRRGVQLVERLAGLDLGAFGEQALLDDAGDAGPHLRGAPGFEAARQLGADRDRLRLRGDHADGGRRRLAGPGSARGRTTTAGRSARRRRTAATRHQRRRQGQRGQSGGGAAHRS